jgi:putative membrane protein
MLKTIAAAAAALALMTGLAVAQAPTPALSDAQIAHIAYTAGQIDIDAAKLALAKSTTPAVTAFANDMVRDHQSVNEQALALLKKLNVTPQDNDTSRALSTAAAAKTKQLSALSGAAFDAAYVANEAAYHEAVNAALATSLIPGAKNADLKGLLSTGLKIFQGHQAHAEMLAATIK